MGGTGIWVGVAVCGRRFPRPAGWVYPERLCHLCLHSAPHYPQRPPWWNLGRTRGTQMSWPRPWMSGLVTSPSLMNLSLMSGVPLEMPRLAVTKPPTGPCDGLSPAWCESLGWEHHSQYPAQAWPSSPRTGQRGGGAEPLPHSNWYHPLPGSQPGWGP